MNNIFQKLLQEADQSASIQDSYAPQVFDQLEGAIGTKERVQLTGYIKRNGKKWAVYLFYFCQGPVCRFYKKCLNSKCRSEVEAKIVLEYGKNFAAINEEDQAQKIEYFELNEN